MSTKGESSKKLVKEKETKTEIVDMDKDSSKGKKKTVAVTEVAEVTEPLEVLEAEEVETAKPPDEVSAGEIREELRELRPKEGEEIIVGPSRLTRFEKARIIG
ncbi:MAG: hypothetical protein V3T40_06250, partial [Nitrososphaerales archaeon]